ncbi:uncharacterized protein LOC121053506 [Oryza brachyantha]|uniref:uncharacterized protein LOC121053506 n=1 Tax=Oryza brachyantha TaxID=4533 RepID=UPI001AD9CE00|nr:uncharacterized protein LOC121053506 [Oryza brachyantha]
MVDVPQFLRFSKVPIMFDRSDHPDRVAHPGQNPPVLAPIFKIIKLKWLLIDGGNTLNILFVKTLDDIKIPTSKLCPSSTPFHGVIFGLFAMPLGQIALLVTFGSKDNYRMKNICFAVADLETAYHAIVGRPALGNFMGVPCGKDVGLQDVSTLCSDVKQAFTCETNICEIVQNAEKKIGWEKIREESACQSEEDEVPSKKMAKISSNDKKQISRDPTDPSTFTFMGTQLDPK